MTAADGFSRGSATRERILVTGASGFVGRHVVRELVADGADVRALVRSSKGANALAGVDCELARGDVGDLDSLREATAGCSGIVHLVAIIHGSPSDFERVIADGARNVVAAARDAGTSRIVHMSALGVGDPAAPDVPYYRTKAVAEETVSASGIPYAILRPSFVFGSDGGALPQFLRIARLSPVTPILGSGRQRLQPLWIGDLARAVALALRHDAGTGAESPVAAQAGPFELGGPDVVDWNELWNRIKAARGSRRPSVHVPIWLVRPQAVLLELLPSPPVTRDQLRMLGGPDNVVSDGGSSMRRLGLADLLPLDEQLARAIAGRPVV